MNQRGVWSKGTDNVLRSLLAGFADMGTMGAGKEAAQGFWKNLLLNVPKHALADLPPGAARRALQPDDVRAGHQSRRRPRQGRG